MSPEQLDKILDQIKLSEKNIIDAIENKRQIKVMSSDALTALVKTGEEVKKARAKS